MLILKERSSGLIKYANFTNRREIIERVIQFYELYGHGLSATTRGILYTITRLSTDTLGVISIKNEQIGRINGVSVSTVRRSLGILEAYGIITRIRTSRNHCVKGYNIVVINR